MSLCERLTVYVFLNNPEQAKDWIDELEDLGVAVVGLPEQFGPQGCIDRVAEAIKTNQYLSVVTMFPQTVNFIGELVYHGLVNREGTCVVLDDGKSTTKHTFDVEGVISDDWPMGCMEPDSSTAIYELKGM